MVGISIFFTKINLSFITTLSFNYFNPSHSVLYWQWNCSPDHGIISLAKMLLRVGSDEDTSAKTKQSRRQKGKKKSRRQKGKPCSFQYLNRGIKILCNELTPLWRNRWPDPEAWSISNPFLVLSTYHLWWSVEELPRDGGFALINNCRSLNH